MTNLYPDKNINYSSKISTSYPRVTINKNEVIDPSDKKGAFTVPFPNNSSDSNLFITLNSKVTLEPNNQPAPRGDIAQVSMSSGSDHIKSQNGPS